MFGLSSIRGPRGGEPQLPASPASGSISPNSGAASALVPILLGGGLLAGVLGVSLIAHHDAPNVSAIEQVPVAEFTNAAKTLTPDGQQQAESGQRQCHAPIYFITAVTPGNPAGGTVTFHTSTYRSPPFHVSDVPVRIALPNPLPDGGLDPLTVQGDANGLVVSLFPTATMTPVNGSTFVTVRWPANPPCK